MTNTTETTTETKLTSDLNEQQTIMAGLIEKARRVGCDHRLVAMANTDFERGFMALEKSIKK